MDFGLGLILSFTDNASSGINSAVNSLGQLTNMAESASASLNEMASLSAFSVVSSQLGNSLVGAGKSVLSIFTNLFGEVQRTGSEFENFRVTLNALYGDADKAETAISKLLDFSIESPFEVDQVKDMLIVLQSQGIDAFNMIEGSVSGVRQETLSWIADLMAFKPDEATTRWKRAMTNYLGSGEDRMLRNILDMGDIDQILGHDIGATAEERLNDLVEIVEKKNLQGLAYNLSTTWTGVGSNIQDAFTKIYKAIADYGVFENLKSAFVGVSGAILSLDNAQLEALGSTIADALNMIVEPLTKAAEKLNGFIMKVVDLCQTHPDIVKWVAVATALVGVLLLAGGVILKIASAFSSLNLMLLTAGKSFSVLKGIFSVGIKKILGTFLPLTLAIGAMSFIWKNDLGGVKTSVTNFVDNLTSAFRTAKTAVSGSVGDMITTLNDLRSKDDFFSNLTVGIMQVMVLFQALSEAWDDNTLSEDTFLKAKELGILPLIEAILDLKYRFEFFKEGFINGWSTIVGKVSDFIAGLTEKVKGTFLEDLLDSITSFIDKLASGDPESWTKFGEVFAYVTAGALALSSIIKVINKVSLAIGGLYGIVKKVSKIFNFFTKIGDKASSLVTTVKNSITAVKTFFTNLANTFSEVWSFIKTVAGILKNSLTKVFTKIGGVLSKAWGYIQPIVTAIKNFFTSTAGGITLIITGAVTAISSFISMLVDGFSWLKEILMVVGIALVAIGAIILGAPVVITAVIAAIVAAVATLIVLIKEHWEEICAFFKTIGTWIYDNVIKPVADFFVELWGKIVTGVKNFIEDVKTFFSTVSAWIKDNVITPVKEFFINLWNDIVTGVQSFIESVKNFFSPIISWIKDNIVTPVADFFTNLWSNIVEGVQTFIENVKTFFSTVASWFEDNVIQPVANFFTNLWNNIVTGVKNFIDSVKNFLSPIVNWIYNTIIAPVVNFFMTYIYPIIAKIVEIVAKIIEIVATLVRVGVQWLVQKVKDFVQNFKNTIQTIVAWIDTNIIQPIVTFFTNLWNNIVTGVQNLINNIVTFFTNVVTWINTNVIQPLITFFKNLWNDIVTGVQNLINNIVTFFTNVVAWINTNVIQPMITFFTNLWNSIVTGVQNLINNIVTFFTNVVLWINTNVIQPIITFFTNLWNSIVTGIQNLITNIYTFFTNAVLWIDMNVIQPIILFFTNLWATIVNGITSFIANAQAVFHTIVSWINTNIITPISTFFTSLWNGIVTGIQSFITKIQTAFTTLKNWIKTNIITPISNFFTTLWSNIKTAFNTVSTAVTSALKGAINTVLQFICKIINSVINGINTAIGVINAIPGVSITKLTLLSIPKLAEGGIVDKPTTALIGEAGKEAVMPLENNTGWISSLARMLVTEMSSGIVPSNTMHTTNNQGDSNNQQYLTNNNTNSTTYEGDSDYSITFNEGAIQIIAQNSSDEEAVRMAKKILEYIKRQKELDRMLSYA